MQVIKTKKIEGCLEGSNVKDLLLDNTITTKFFNYISVLGKSVINERIDKPFFKIIVRGKYSVKGSFERQSLRIILPESYSEDDINDLISFINKYSENEN